MNENILSAKNLLIIMINRIFIDRTEKAQFVKLIEDHQHSFPLKAVLEKLRSTPTIPLNTIEKNMMDELKFIYI